MLDCRRVAFTHRICWLTFQQAGVPTYLLTWVVTAKQAEKVRRDPRVAKEKERRGWGLR